MLKEFQYLYKRKRYYSAYSQYTSTVFSDKPMIENDDVIIFYKNVCRNFRKTQEVIRILIDFIPDSDAILKILYVDLCGKVKVNSDSSSKTV